MPWNRLTKGKKDAPMDANRTRTRGTPRALDGVDPLPRRGIRMT